MSKDPTSQPAPEAAPTLPADFDEAALLAQSREALAHGRSSAFLLGGLDLGAMLLQALIPVATQAVQGVVQQAVEHAMQPHAPAAPDDRTHDAFGRPITPSFGQRPVAGFSIGGSSLQALAYLPALIDVMTVVGTVDSNHDGKWSPEEVVAGSTALVQSLLRDLPNVRGIVKNPEEVQGLVTRVADLFTYIRNMGHAR